MGSRDAGRGWQDGWGRSKAHLREHGHAEACADIPLRLRRGGPGLRNQARLGGGVGGPSQSGTGWHSATAYVQGADGGPDTIRPGVSRKSFLNSGNLVNLSWSCCLFSVIALHILQGYWPLTVILTAVMTGTCPEYSCTILTQAIPWRTYQCPPHDKTKADKRTSIENLRSTARNIRKQAPGSNDYASTARAPLSSLPLPASFWPFGFQLPLPLHPTAAF